MSATDTRNQAVSFSLIPIRGPLFGFVLLVLFIVGARYAIFEQYKKSIIDNEIQDLGAVADAKVAQIVSWREAQKRRAEYFLHGAMFPGEVEQWLHDGAPSGKQKNKIINALYSLKREQGYMSILLFDRKGAVRASTDDRDEAVTIENNLFAAAMRSRQVIFSDLHREAHEGNNISIDCLAPLMVIDAKNNSHIVGSLLFEINPDLFLYPMIQSWPTHSASAETVLIERDGNDVLFLNELRHQKDTALSLRIPLTNTQLPGVMSILGHTEMSEGIDYRGIPVVAELRSIPNTPWFVVAKVDQAELFAPIYHLEIWTAGLGIVFIVLAGGLFFFWYRAAQSRYQQLKIQHDAALDRELLLKHFEYLNRYANDMIIVANEAGQIIEANERAEQNLGYSREELLQMNVLELHDTNEREAIPDKLDELSKVEDLRLEAHFLRKNGNVFPVEISARVINVEGKRYLQGIIRDISERKSAEDKLRLHSAILTHLSEGIMLVNGDGLIVFTNPQFERMLGYGPDEMLGKHVSMVNAPGDSSSAEVAAEIISELNKSGTWNGEVHNIKKDGTTFWCHASVSTFEHATFGSVWVSVHEDITARKLAEIEILEAKVQAEQANRAKNEFLSRMSHELRTPLNSIIGFAQIMEVSEDEPVGNHLDSLKTIVRSGWHLLRIIEDLLNLSAIEAGKVELVIGNVDLGSCIKECFALMEPLASQKQIEFTCADEEFDGVVVLADAFRLKQVLINLLANAVKFNSIGGKVTISGKSIAGRIQIKIIDTGPGIPEDEIPFLFQPFSRLSKRPLNIEGAGIGLSIAKQLIELMGGKIGVESIRYLGSKFWIELPVTRASIKNSINPVLKDRSATTGNKVMMLYIEDNPDHVHLVREIVSRMDNISLITAHTPSLGLDMAWANSPDIIILDICLPGMNGYEVLELLKSSKITRNTPVVAISASINPAEIEKGLLAGFRRYLKKPINILEFRQAIVELLRDKVEISED